MAPKKNVTKEERKLQKRIAERERYARLKSDPTKVLEMKMKNQEKKKRRKEEGKEKNISDMTEREKRSQRKKWRECSRNYRQKKKDIIKAHESDSHNVSDVAVPSRNVTYQVSSGEKRRRVNRRKLRNEIKKLEDEKIRLRKKVDLMRKKYLRECLKSQKNITNDSKSPNTKVQNILKHNDRKLVKQRLLFGETLVHQIKENWKMTKNKGAKRCFSRAIIGDGKWLKRYGFLGKCNFISSVCFRNDIRSRQSKSLKNRRARKLTDIVKADVQSFLEEESHSRVCPGKKDCITRNKVKKQKRLLLGNLKNLHKGFLETHPYKISYASFCRLKPFWILTPNVAQRNTCQCVIHENFHLLLRGLSNAKAIANPDPTTIKKQLCCDTVTESCLFKKCRYCKDNCIRYEIFDGALLVNYLQWMKTKVQYTDPKTKALNTTSRIVKQTVNKPTIDLVRKADSEAGMYLAHEGKVLHQHSEVKKLKASLRQGEILIHCDFSENYATKYHSEIQAVHFGGNRLNLSLHTVVVYYREDNSDPISLKNFCTISENLDHGPSAIWAHFTPLFDFLKNNWSTPISKIHFLSDGPSSQYRNKTLFFLFQHRLNDVFTELVEATWNYYESGHGKGAPDGLGATVKRTADRTVAQGEDVADIDAFVMILRNAISNIQIEVIESSAIDAMVSSIPKSLKPFKGTMEVHQVAWKKGDPRLHMNKLSCFSCTVNCMFYKIGNHQRRPMNKKKIVVKTRTPPTTGNTKLLNQNQFSFSGSSMNVLVQPLELTSYHDQISQVRMPPSGDEFYNHLTPNRENSKMQEISPISADILLIDCDQLDNSMTHVRKLTQENPLPKDFVINAEAQ